jgi:hypothetical protein
MRSTLGLTRSTGRVNDLQREILRTHESAKRGNRGAKARLKELQRLYREGGHSIERFPAGATCELIEPGASVSRPRLTLVDRTRRRPPERSSRPSWMLTEPKPESWRLR